MTVPAQAQAQRPAARVPAAAPELLASLAGLAFLLARPGLEALPPGARTGVLAAGYLALALAAGAAAAEGQRGEASASRAGIVLAAGVAVVGLAAVLARPVPPVPGGTVALGLGVLAAVAEEALFRGALYMLLRRRGVLLAVAVPAVAFALIHVPSYGLAALPVDLGAGLLFGWQRWASGRWTVPAATHAAANLLAVILR